METERTVQALHDALSAIDSVVAALTLAARTSLASQRVEVDIARAALRVREARARLEADA